MTPLLLDCDPGIDDALALLLACAHRELDLLAVTTVAGNRPVDITSANAGRLLELAGRAEVPVHAGAARPLAHAQPRCNLVHGEDGLGGVSLPAGRAPAAEHASDAIARTLLAAEPSTINLAAVGPLTNLALAEIKHPGVLRRAKALLVMGGAAFRPGNVTPCAEFNFWADALAAHTVMEAGAQVHLFGLDVTSQAAMPAGWIASLAELGTRSGRAACAMLQAYAVEDPLLHDVCPLAWLIDPTVFTAEPCAVSVDWRPGPTEGQSVVWSASRGHQPPATNALVYTRVDAARLLRRVREALAGLP
jgi:purine nucleosidase